MERGGEGWGALDLCMPGGTLSKVSEWRACGEGACPLLPEGSPLTFTSIFWEAVGRWAATNQSPAAGWEMLREALLSSILMKKGDCTELLAGKLVPKGLMTGGAP